MLDGMIRKLSLLCVASCLAGSYKVFALNTQVPLQPNSNLEETTWLEKYGKQIDQTFSGPLSFSHLPYSKCLEEPTVEFDIALLGMPFDTAVTYRPGARFGPYAIRSGSRRQREARGYTLSWRNNPYEQGSKIIDCGDVCLRLFYVYFTP